AQRAVLGELAGRGGERVGAAHLGAVGLDALEGDVLAGLEVEGGAQLRRHGQGHLEGILREGPDPADGELVPRRAAAALVELDGHALPSPAGKNSGPPSGRGATSV